MNQPRRSVDLAQSVRAALFAALMIAGAYISIPLPFTPVPIVLQNLFVLLAGLTLGAAWGATSVALYLLLGLLGLPVFAQARGGLAHLAGPTGGYLLGFLAAAAISGLISGATGRLWRSIAGVSIGSCAIYAIGVPWLKAVTGLDWSAAIALGLVPFVIGDILKAIAAVAVAQALLTTGLIPRRKGAASDRANT